MRILVYPHDLAVGGSQLNALELAAAVRGRGHDVLVHGTPGPLVERVHELGLEFVEAPPIGRRPSPAAVAGLRRLAGERGIDVLHGYEWPPGLECSLASLRSPAVAVTTVMSMAVAPFLPRSGPVVVGTAQILAHERARGRSRVRLLEPPVDTELNRPGAPLDLDAFRARWGLDDGRPLVVCVTRLAHQLKLEGVRTAIEAMPEVARATSARLLLVGGGDARDEVAALAADVNRRAGAGTVVLTGELGDPRPAYSLADVALGMGGSALRAMAFGAPLVVLGEGGYVEPLTEETLPGFLWRGWYGYGGEGDPGSRLARTLVGLLADPVRRSELGRLGRWTVEQRFSLEAAARRQEQIYAEALTETPGALSHGRGRCPLRDRLRALPGRASRRPAARAPRRGGLQRPPGGPVGRGRAARPARCPRFRRGRGLVRRRPLAGRHRHRPAPGHGVERARPGRLGRPADALGGATTARTAGSRPSSQPLPRLVRVSTSCPPGVSRPGLPAVGAVADRLARRARGAAARSPCRHGRGQRSRAVPAEATRRCCAGLLRDRRLRGGCRAARPRHPLRHAAADGPTCGAATSCWR